MRIGWCPLPAALFALCLARSARTEDDVASILADLSSTAAPCADRIGALDRAVEAQPGDPALRRERGLCLYQLGRLELARADLVAGLVADGAGADPEPWVVGAILDARAGLRPSALARLAQARELAGREHPMVLRGAILLQGIHGDYPGAWAALDAALERHREDPVLRVAATELIALDPDGATASARAAVGRRVKTVTRHNRASGWLNAGQPAACVHEAEGALSESDPDDAAAVAALQVLAWRCGVAAGDVGAATRHLKAMGRSALAEQPPGTVIAHVRLLRDAGQLGSALKLLQLVQPRAEVDRQERATLAVGIRVLQGDLDGALSEASAETSAVGRANLAKALHAAGRTAEAVSLLDRTCSELDDPKACEAWRAHLRSGL